MPRDLRSSALSALMGGEKLSPRAPKPDESPAAGGRTGGAKPARRVVPTSEEGTEPVAQGKVPKRNSTDDAGQAARAGAGSTKQTRGQGKVAKRPIKHVAPAADAPAADAPVADAPVPAADGYVGRSQYQRKRRGLVAKVAVHLSPDVAAALRRAGAVGDENGINMSEIVETLLVQAGYGS